MCINKPVGRQSIRTTLGPNAQSAQTPSLFPRWRLGLSILMDGRSDLTNARHGKESLPDSLSGPPDNGNPDLSFQVSFMIFISCYLSRSSVSVPERDDTKCRGFWKSVSCTQSRVRLANEHAQQTVFFPGAHNDNGPGIYDMSVYSPR